jgi:hypothetical protein
VRRNALTIWMIKDEFMDRRVRDYPSFEDSTVREKRQLTDGLLEVE